MIDEQELRERLKTVDVPPTGLTATALVTAGRKRAVRRRTLRTGCGVGLAVVLAFTAQTVVARAGGLGDSAAGLGRIVLCDATQLAQPPEADDVEATAVDPSGRYILGNAVTRRGKPTAGKPEDLDLRPLLWTRGDPALLPLIGASVRASAVNAEGMVAAVGGPSDNRGRWASVIRYVRGVPEKLDAPAGSWVFDPIPKITANGDISAIAYRKSSPHDPAVLTWKAGSTTPVRWTTLPAGIETLNVTDAGTVIADVVAKEKHTVYVLDQQGNRRQLATPGDEGGYNFASRGDWVTANLSATGSVARWSLSTGELADTGVTAPANGVNAEGWVLAGETVQRDDATVELADLDGLTGAPVDASDTGIVIGALRDFTNPSPSAAPGSPSSFPASWECPS